MKRRLIVIPFNVSWSWSTDYLNQTAFELARLGNTVICYLYGDTKLFKDIFNFRKPFKIVSRYSKNIYLITPINYLPFRRFEIIRDLNSTINRLILRTFSSWISVKEKIDSKIFWIFDPNLVYVFKKFKNYFLLYDSVDYFPVGTKREVARTNRAEKFLCKKADLVTANSHVLQNHLKKYRKDIRLVPQGFRVSDFIKKSKAIALKIKKPVIGFVGAVNYRIDYDLLIKLAAGSPDWNFVIWGPVLEREKIDKKTWNKMQKLLSFPNVTNGKSSDKKEIPGIISQFDVCIIPYDMSQDFNKYCHPMKLFEYMYLGKPIVSSSILELKYFKDFVHIENNFSGWQSAIWKSLKHPLRSQKKLAMKKLSESNSWENKVGQILSFLPDKF